MMTPARSFGLCLSFFFASTAAAQLVGPEVLSTPFTPQSSPGMSNSAAVSMARLGQSAVVAWPINDGTSGTQRILLARLGGQLHAMTSREVPRLSRGDDASWPSIATDGTSVLVVWSEAPAGVAAALFDRDLNLLAGPALLLAGNYKGHATSAGDTFVVVVNNVVFRFTRSTFSTPQTINAWVGPPVGGAMDGVVVNPNWGIQLMGIWTTRTQVGGCPPCFIRCGASPCPPIQFVDHSSIFFLTLYRDPIAWTPPTLASYRTMASGIGDTLTIWRTDSIQSVGALAATVIPGDPSATIPPALRLDVLDEAEPGAASTTWDGERYAIVWQARTSSPTTPPDHAIAFATIENGSIALRSIIVDTPADELRPSIIAIAPGEYIVAYETVSGREHRLGGRIVLLEPGGRRRPAG